MHSMSSLGNGIVSSAGAAAAAGDGDNADPSVGRRRRLERKVCRTECGGEGQNLNSPFPR